MDVVSYSRIFTSYRDKLTKFWNASSINFTFREVMLSYLDTRYLVLSISFSNISVSTRPILEKQSNQLIRGNAKVSKDFAKEN